MRKPNCELMYQQPNPMFHIVVNNKKNAFIIGLFMFLRMIQSLLNFLSLNFKILDNFFVIEIQIKTMLIWRGREFIDYTAA